MVIMELRLDNPKINVERSSCEYDPTTLLNETIQYLMSKMQPKENDDVGALVAEMKKVFPKSDVLPITAPNTFGEIDSLEKQLSQYEYAYIIAIPNLSSKPCMVCCNKLDTPCTIPLYWCVPDYIDLLYCLYSYLII